MKSDDLWNEIKMTLGKATKDHGRNQAAALSEKIELLQFQMNQLKELHKNEFEQLHGPMPQIYKDRTGKDPTKRILNQVKKTAQSYTLTPQQWNNIGLEIYIHLAPGMKNMRYEKFNGDLTVTLSAKNKTLIAVIQ